MSSQTKYLLDESKLPKFWYNINADMPVPPEPVLHPGTLEPVTPDFPERPLSDAADHAGDQHRALY